MDGSTARKVLRFAGSHLSQPKYLPRHLLLPIGSSLPPTEVATLAMGDVLSKKPPPPGPGLLISACEMATSRGAATFSSRTAGFSTVKT
jgi:hypothetical protein